MKKFLGLAVFAMAVCAGAMSFYSGGGDASTDAGQTWAGPQAFTNAANTFTGTNIQASAIGWGNLNTENYDDASAQIIFGTSLLSADGTIHTPSLFTLTDGSGQLNPNAAWDAGGNLYINHLEVATGTSVGEGSIMIGDFGYHTGDWQLFSATNGIFTMTRANDEIKPNDTNTVFTLTPSGTLSVSNFIGKFTGDGSGLTGLPGGGSGGGTTIPTNTWWVSIDGNPFGSPATGIPMGDVAHTVKTNITLAIVSVLTNGGTVFIGPGTFPPVSTTRFVQNSTNFAGTNQLTIIGSGQTEPNTNYSQILDNGQYTVVVGPMYFNRPNVSLANFNIDSGKVECTNYFSGAATDGVQFYSPNQLGWTTNVLNRNIKIKNMTVLGYQTNSPNHDVLFENVYDGTLENIHTYLNSAGIIIKGYRVTGHDLVARGHSSYAFIIKANNYAAPALNDPFSFAVSGCAAGNITLEHV